jgi:hypothetical protein
LDKHKLEFERDEFRAISSLLNWDTADVHCLSGQELKERLDQERPGRLTGQESFPELEQLQHKLNKVTPLEIPETIFTRLKVQYEEVYPNSIVHIGRTAQRFSVVTLYGERYGSKMAASPRNRHVLVDYAVGDQIQTFLGEIQYYLISNMPSFSLPLVLPGQVPAARFTTSPL